MSESTVSTAQTEETELSSQVASGPVPTKRLMLAAAIMLAVVALDQLSKVWAREALASGSMTFIPGILDFQLTFNTGAAFSIGQGKGFIFTLVAAVVVVAVFILIWREPKMPLAFVCTLSCVAGGGLGNMIDRLALGKVTDFIATNFIDFPVFNVADMFVTCGVILTIILLFVLDK